MEVLFILIPVSIALASASVVACLVAIRGGQYDDMESPRWRILFDGRHEDGRGHALVLPGSDTDESEKERLTTTLNDEHTGAKAQRSTPL
jgi:cbb3-type cytochrome oxidase maturation protein